MRSDLLALGSVAALAAAGIAASRRRGSRDEEDGEFFHVTEAENVPDILASGFVAGWGDVGFGVYFYGTYESARAYARKGGWDKKLRHPALLVVRDPRIRKIALHEIHGSWDASKYADMYVLDGDEDDEDAPIRPAEVADEGPIPPARAKKVKKGSPARREPTESHAASRDLLPGLYYHGRTSNSTAFDPAKTGDRWANNQDGPGFYFTSDPRDARTYAHPDGVVLRAKLQPRKLVPHTGRVPVAQVDRLLRQAPDLEDVLTNWDEDPRVAYRELLAAVTRPSSPWEAFLEVWGEAYRRAGDNAAWLAGMTALGYDGVVSPSSWGTGEDGRPVQHVVMFSPDRIQDVEVFERRRGSRSTASARVDPDLRVAWGEALRGWLDSPAARVTLGPKLSTKLNPWHYGGCRILAEALHRLWRDSRIVGVDAGGLDDHADIVHLLVAHAGGYWDADGFHATPKDALEWVEKIADAPCEIVSYNPVHAQGIASSVAEVDALVAAIRSALGPMRWNPAQRGSQSTASTRVTIRVALPDAIRRHAQMPDFGMAWPSFRPDDSVRVVDDRHGNMLEILVASGGKLSHPLSPSDGIRAWQKLAALQDYFGKLRFPLRVYRGLRVNGDWVAPGGHAFGGNHWTVNRQIAQRFATGDHDAANWEPSAWPETHGESREGCSTHEVLLSGVIECVEDVNWHRTLTDYLVYTLGSETHLNTAEEQVHSSRVTRVKSIPVRR